MILFSSDYSPSAPIIPVQLRSADGTSISRTLAASIQVESIGVAIVRSQFGKPLTVSRFSVHLQFPMGERIVAQAIESPLDDGLVIGRNILNRLKFTYDGIANTLTIHEIV